MIGGYSIASVIVSDEKMPVRQAYSLDGLCAVDVERSLDEVEAAEAHTVESAYAKKHRSNFDVWRIVHEIDTDVRTRSKISWRAAEYAAWRAMTIKRALRARPDLLALYTLVHVQKKFQMTDKQGQDVTEKWLHRSPLFRELVSVCAPLLRARRMDHLGEWFARGRNKGFQT